jgi:hypothetical protein
VKAKELEDLADAVRTENHRLYALQEQRKYVPSVHPQVLASHSRSFDSGNAALVQIPPEEFLQLNSEGIDWERVASAVGLSSSSSVGMGCLLAILFFEMTSGHGSRIARECKIKWMGDRYPSINRAQWSQPEISKCRDLVDAYRTGHGQGATVDWAWVANELKVTPGKRFK